MARKAGPTNGSGMVSEDSTVLSPDGRAEESTVVVSEGATDPVEPVTPSGESRAVPEAIPEPAVPAGSDDSTPPVTMSQVGTPTSRLSDADTLGQPSEDANPEPVEVARPDLSWGAEPPLAFRPDPSPEDESLRRTSTPEAAVSDRDSRPVDAGGREQAGGVPRTSARRRGGFSGLFMGGLIAAALGFGSAWLAQDRFGLLGPRLPVDLTDRLSALEARPIPDVVPAEDLAQRLAEAEARLSVLEDSPPAANPAPPVDLAPLREEVEADLGAVLARADALDARLSEIEARLVAPAAEASPGSPAPDPGPALALPQGSSASEDVPALEPRLTAFEADLAALRDTLTQATGEIDALRSLAEGSDVALMELGTRLSSAETALTVVDSRLAEAEAAAAAAADQARTTAAAVADTQARAADAEVGAQRASALTQLDEALDAGMPFEAPLAELGPEAPEALARVATEGVPTLAALREAFPEAARAGLAAARAQGLAGDAGGLSGFFRDQLSLRSTAPREGDDPDAVLSRAEAALAAGRLDEALAEIAILPEPTRAAMSDWIASAQARSDALTALATLRSGELDPAPAN